ncbi:MAG TPA: type II toxin-antitoxin system VapC family toxin [Treponemataceae bacterium]|nr:type II toxin-antitoxin system VapC family toxin [Treponemataceae bacterium]HPS45212.1 type II toxin-antitoxin system VapC family toxin [Treponemataceae bacterium]
MNIVDSSCWLEFFAGSSVGDKVSGVIINTKELLVPSITLYEVFKKILIELDEDKGLLAVAHMKQGNVIELDSDLAIYAAKIGKEHQLALVDSIIYAVAKRHNATLWTQDKHFKDLDNVKYFEKEK